MAATELDKLRNVGILGHGGSGKTSLGEAMLFAAGATQRLGKVQDGTSVLDHEPEEIKHHVSISTAFHSLIVEQISDHVDRHAGLRGVSGRFDLLHARFFQRRLRAQSGGRACGSSPSAYGPKPMKTVSAGCSLSARWTMNRPTSTSVSRRCSKRLEAKGVYLQMPIGVRSRVQRRRRSLVHESLCLRRRLAANTAKAKFPPT